MEQPAIDVYSPAIPDGLCRYETPVRIPYPSNLSGAFDLTGDVEKVPPANDYVSRELERIKPLLEIGKPLTNTDSCSTAQQFRDRNIDILLSLKYCSEIQDKYRSFGIDVTPLIEFVEGVKQQLIALLSNSPALKYLN